MRAALLLMALLCGAGAAWSAADPTQPQVPQMQFVPPAPGTYELQRIQRTPDALLLDADNSPQEFLTLGTFTVK